MRYRAGSVGRVFLARIDHGENVLDALTELCLREGVAAGWFLLFGAVAEGTFVTGPEKPVLPPTPIRQTVLPPHEIVGTGSVATKDGLPALHLHASLGRGRDALTGCLRRDGEAFVVVEALLLELSGIPAVRRPDAKTGLELLDVE